MPSNSSPMGGPQRPGRRGQRTTVAIIPARAGSKGLPRKNVRPLGGAPLYRHAVEQAEAVDVDRIIITTDIPEILKSEFGSSVRVHARPTELCGDDVEMAPVLLDALDAQGLPHATVVLLQVTSPLRSPAAIRSCVELYDREDVDLVMTVTQADRGVLKYGTVEAGRFHALRDPSHPFTNRQSLPPVYRPNGAVFVFESEWLHRNRGLRTDSIAVHEMSAEDSVDIDTLEDLERCEQILAARRSGEA